MAASSKATRECTRAPKYSILLSNILGIQLSPSSVAESHNVDGTNEYASQPKQSSSGREIFDSFLEENQSTMNTRLNETLSDVKYAGWIQPSTILIKGPTDELDVLREAWRRRFLRSPLNFAIREIGNISSVGMELVPQAPFLPLTQALYEAISTLNENQLPCTQKDVYQYLAHTYQYVHVPKVHVIHDCLGILIKERRIFYTGNGYFAIPDKGYEKEEDKGEKNTASGEKAKDASHCSMCEASKKKDGKSHKRKSTSKEKDCENLCDKHKKAVKRTHSHRRRESSKEANSLSTSIDSTATGQGSEASRVVSSITSESSGSPNAFDHSGSEGKSKGKQNKGNVFGQIASFIKGRKSSNSGASQESHSEKESEKEEGNARNKTTTITVLKEEDLLQAATDKGKENSQGTRKESEQSTRISSQVITERAHKEKMTEPEKITRSRSFIAPNKKRPEFLRSNSFTAPSNKTISKSRSLSNTESDNSPRLRTKSAEQELSVRGSAEYRRPPAPKSQEVSSVQVEPTKTRYLSSSSNRNSTCAIGIVRPMSTYSQTVDLESSPLSSSSTMKENHRYSTSSFGTPQSDRKSSGSESSKNFSRNSLIRGERSFDYIPVKIAKAPERDSLVCSPLQHILTKNTSTSVPVTAPSYSAKFTSTPLPLGNQYTSSSSTLTRSLSAASSRSTLQYRHSFHGSSNKRSSWRTPVLSRDDGYYDVNPPEVTSYKNRPSSRQEVCLSPICYDQSKLVKKSGQCKCNGNSCCHKYEQSYSTSDHTDACSEKDDQSSIYTKSDHVLLDEISSSASSTDYRSGSRLRKIENDSALSPLTIAEGQVVMDSSLTFIGVI